MADWAQLLDDLLRLIIKRVASSSLSSYLNFSAVCRSWRCIAVENRHYIPRQFPGLMIPGSNEERGNRNFYILSQKRVFERKIHVPHSKTIRGSLGGWVVTTDESLNMHIFNPFTEVQIQLPHITTFPNREAAGMPYCSHYVHRTTLSSIPTSTSLTVSGGDCIVMAIYGGFSELAFARPGDEAWTPIECPRHSFNDVIFHRGQFYAVNSTGLIVVCDVCGSNPKTLIEVALPSTYMAGPRYLVESSGELLQVVRIREWESFVDDSGETITPPYETIDFEVYKLDISGLKWNWGVEVECLGDQMLFVGYTSFSLSASNFPGCRGSCIYFTDDYSDAHFGGFSFSGTDMGIFDMDDGSVQQLFPIGSQSTFPPPVWITPIPW